jgi:hypothetical protein
MYCAIACSRSATLAKLSRRRRFWEMSRKNRSTLFGHEVLVGGEVDDETRMLGQPLANLGMPVAGVVVHDQVQLQMLGRLALDQAQELRPLLVAVAVLAHRDDRAVE